jgi:hypothetical protein
MIVLSKVVTGLLGLSSLDEGRKSNANGLLINLKKMDREAVPGKAEKPDWQYFYGCCDEGYKWQDYAESDKWASYKEDDARGIEAAYTAFTMGATSPYFYNFSQQIGEETPLHTRITFLGDDGAFRQDIVDRNSLRPVRRMEGKQKKYGPDLPPGQLRQKLVQALEECANQKDCVQLILANVFKPSFEISENVRGSLRDFHKESKVQETRKKTKETRDKRKSWRISRAK